MPAVTAHQSSNRQPMPNRTKIGLALGSGIARGWAHIGVVRALEEAGIVPDIICGTSIGALVGGVHLAGKLDVLEEWARNLTRVKILRYFDFQLNSGGLIAGRRLQKLLEENLSGVQVENLERSFASVTTELATGHEIWIQEGCVVDAITASYALPGVFPPVKVDGRWLVDGALVNPVPVSVCRALGARIVIAVNLNADVFGKGNVSGEIADDRTADELLAQLDNNKRKTFSPTKIVMRQIFGHSRNIPSIFSTMVGSLNIVQDRLSRSRLAGDPPDVSIAPRLGHVGLLEFNKAEEAIDEGYQSVERSMPALRDALSVLAG